MLSQRLRQAPPPLTGRHLGKHLVDPFRRDPSRFLADSNVGDVGRCLMRPLIVLFALLATSPAFAGKKKVGEGPCRDGTDCASGTCVEVNGDRYCSQTCGACPEAMVCDDKLLRMAGISVCVKGSAKEPPAVEPQRAPPQAPSRVPCAADHQCPRGLICAEFEGARECTRSCTDDAQCAMPDMMGMKSSLTSCQRDAGRKASRSACLPKKECLANPMACMGFTPGVGSSPRGEGLPGAAGDGDSVEKQETAKPRRDSGNVAEIGAKLDGTTITLADGRVFTLRETNVMLPYPELEIKAPAGARVDLYYGDKLLHGEEAPYLFKDLEIDKYLKVVVKEPSGTWSVKFMPKKGQRTTLVDGGATAAPFPVRPPAPPAPPPPPPAPSAAPSCEKTMLAKGHHSMHLSNCKGVDAACAVAVLEAGHHPQDLSNCAKRLPIQCVKAVLANGHHPMHLSNCEGVDVSCALSILENGEHPMHLSNCKR